MSSKSKSSFFNNDEENSKTNNETSARKVLFSNNLSPLIPRPCASARTHSVTNDPNDVWICTTDGQMSQICILNSLPELAVSSYNTVCNSKITCIQCVPPYHLKHIDSTNSKKLLANTDTDDNLAIASRR